MLTRNGSWRATVMLMPVALVATSIVGYVAYNTQASAEPSELVVTREPVDTPEDTSLTGPRDAAWAAAQIELHLQNDVTAPQEAALADGFVTIDEMNAASDRLAACGASFGYTPVILPGEGLRPTEVQFSVPDADGIPDGDTVAEANANLGDCRYGQWSATHWIWDLQLLASTEEISALYDAIEACVAGGGVPGGLQTSNFNIYANAPNRAIAVDEADMGAYRECASKLEAETGLQAPPPNRAR